MAKEGPQSRGRQAELRACRYLEERGLVLAERNYRCRAGEIDLVMRDRDWLVFVEVRMRSNLGFGSGADTVDARKQARILAAAAHYLQHHGKTDFPCRLDVVSISGAEDDAVEWIRDAFHA